MSALNYLEARNKKEEKQEVVSQRLIERPLLTKYSLR